MLITVGYALSDLKRLRVLYAHSARAAIDRCRYCVDYERTLPIYVLSGATGPILPRLWASLKHFD